MPINKNYDEKAVTKAIAKSLDEFYASLIEKIDKLNIRNVMKRKNPYLYRAKAMRSAAEIVEVVLSAFVSSSEETIFGNCFFEPLAIAVSGGEPKIYQELAGGEFWRELTGDAEFYKKIIALMGTLPEARVAAFKESYAKAQNRLVREFSNDFCKADGSIDWEKLVEFNSGD